ncbi:hypothetical protein [Tolypothrix sp. VBCCA 56010]|uniref:hypothetical protein n=1 Tax=Tolypothrix sp. VBCCA 56010 TaxID=3137731 RepID=UPI003D7CC4A5
MSNPGYKRIDPEFDLGVASLEAARDHHKRKDIEGAKKKSKEAIEQFKRCDTNEAKEKLNEAQQFLDNLG